MGVDDSGVWCLWIFKHFSFAFRACKIKLDVNVKDKINISYNSLELVHTSYVT